jgi:hypothetical protein
MVGVFRLVRQRETEFYELVTLAEVNGSLELRLKHFGPELVGWEEKDESVVFPLVRMEPDRLWFDGLTMHRVGPGRMQVWVALTNREGAVHEELFEYERVATDQRDGAPPTRR